MSFSSEIKRLDQLIHDNKGVRLEISKNLSAPTFDEDEDFEISFYSLEEFIDEFMFKRWKYRGTCINCKDMREALDLEAILLETEPPLEHIVSYCEYVANLKYLFERANNMVWEYVRIYKTEILSLMDQNISSLLDSLNLKLVSFENEERVLITEKNATVTAVAECVDEELAYQIVKYNHYTLKGDISKKKEILLKLGSELEPKRKQLSSLNGQLETNIFFMLNNLNIRHTNRSKKDKNYKEYVAKMKKNKLEEWYDELYQMMLLAMLELEQLERNQKINELKAHF